MGGGPWLPARPVGDGGDAGDVALDLADEDNLIGRIGRQMPREMLVLTGYVLMSKKNSHGGSARRLEDITMRERMVDWRPIPRSYSQM